MPVVNLLWRAKTPANYLIWEGLDNPVDFRRKRKKRGWIRIESN
jgi:hypothetical protein